MQVICVANSSLHLDGRLGEAGSMYWAVVVKDLNQRGYYIRMVEKEVGHLIGWMKIK